MLLLTELLLHLVVVLRKNKIALLLGNRLVLLGVVK